MFLHAESEDSDQTGRMPRLICVFAGRNGHFVGLVIRRLMYTLQLSRVASRANLTADPGGSLVRLRPGHISFIETDHAHSILSLIEKCSCPMFNLLDG